jgi:hypothetical protein
MPRPRIKIAPHLDYAELTQRYETCDNPRVKNYWLAIQLLSDPDSPMLAEQVAQHMGCSVDWIRKLAGRYNRLGPSALSSAVPKATASLHRAPANSRTLKTKEQIGFALK